jgi:hypothetical protein
MAKVADPAPSASLALVSSARRDRPRPIYCVHGAVLWLAGSLLAWVRTWDASLAAHRARNSLLGCKDTILITTAVRWQNTVHGEENWCYKPEGLLHHRRLVQ